jgi:predicted ArsR family transcriptional regulator
VEDEILLVMRAKGKLDLTHLADQLKISPESTLYFLGKLVRDGKAVISEIRATGVAGGL